MPVSAIPTYVGYLPTSSGAYGPRKGQVVNAALDLCAAVFLAAVAVGVYNLQSWLEHSEQQRDLED